jgi:xanthine dehydrogenase molybdopterin-binding subunit B
MNKREALVANEPAQQPVVGRSLPHESAHLHVSGAAPYTDDLPEPARCTRRWDCRPSPTASCWASISNASARCPASSPC